MSHLAAVDAVLKAMADPTRRLVLERLGRGPAAVTDLSQPFDMALPSFTQHLRVLEDAGLVHSKKKGRVRTYQIVPERMRVLEGWLARQRRLWERRLDQLDDYLERMKKE